MSLLKFDLFPLISASRQKAAVEALFARVISFCFNEPRIAETSLAAFIQRNFCDKWLWLLDVYFNAWHNLPDNVERSSVSHITGIGDFTGNPRQQSGLLNSQSILSRSKSVYFNNASTSAVTEKTQSVENTNKKIASEIPTKTASEKELRLNTFSATPNAPVHITNTTNEKTDTVGNTKEKPNFSSSEGCCNITDQNRSFSQQTSTLEVSEQQQITVVRVTKKILVKSDKSQQPESHKSRFSDTLPVKERGNKSSLVSTNECSTDVEEKIKTEAETPDIQTKKEEEKPEIKIEIDNEVKIKKEIISPVIISSDNSDDEIPPVKKEPNLEVREVSDPSLSSPNSSTSVLNQLLSLSCFEDSAERNAKRIKEERQKLKSWENSISEQISLSELKNQLPAKKNYNLAMLNKFDFIKDLDFEVIFADRFACEEQERESLIWFVELKLNRGMFKFYGKSKSNWNKALNNALIVALNFCTLKIVHECVIPRHLVKSTQFLTHCFLTSEYGEEINDLGKGLPKVDLKRKHVNEQQVAKKRKRAKESAIDSEKETFDDSFVFEVNLIAEKMHFCFERKAESFGGALNESLLHVLKKNLNYIVA